MRLFWGGWGGLFLVINSTDYSNTGYQIVTLQHQLINEMPEIETVKNVHISQINLGEF